ncbi:MAG: helicase associated domain-containing protein [Leptospiraceae bacterium]|nr:helicase associated domain-containing protein [Leptospiraceae bacterium]MDW8306859.1 helicase associated domain-containing protein [Leptospiraceae bacterium]
MRRKEAKWQELYRQLKEFYEREGRLPRRDEHPQLYTWCAVQRMKYKAGALSQEQIESLNQIHFIWNLQQHSWEQNYDLLLEFRKKNPHRWPSQRSREPVEHHLAVWFLGIRKDYKNGKLSPERIRLLEKIHFPFYPREERWNKTYEKVLEFRMKNGKLPDRNGKSEEEKRLHNWLKYQLIKKEYDVLSPQQVEKLEQLDLKEFAQKYL